MPACQAYQACLYVGKLLYVRRDLTAAERRRLKSLFAKANSLMRQESDLWDRIHDDEFVAGILKRVRAEARGARRPAAP
jgi:hypothetical protein